MNSERLEKEKIEEDFREDQGDIRENELKKIPLDIEKAIEEAKKTKEEEPCLVWVMRLVGNEPPWPHPRGEKKLAEVFKKLGVDVEKGRRVTEDKNHLLCQRFKEEQEKERNVNSSLERRLITIEVQKTNEPGVTFVRSQWWLVNKEEKTHPLTTEYSLYTNLETKKESK